MARCACACPPSCLTRVVLWRGLQQPNEKLVELLLTAQTARRLGAKHVSLVAPYLAYMRQDIEFNPGEAVSQRIVGGFLAGLFDAVITVDPHLHRVATLHEAMPVKDAIALSGAPLLADHIATQRQNPLLMGPDEEVAAVGGAGCAARTAGTMRCAARRAMAIGRWTSSCPSCRWPAARWC